MFSGLIRSHTHSGSGRKLEVETVRRRRRSGCFSRKIPQFYDHWVTRLPKKRRGGGVLLGQTIIATGGRECVFSREIRGTAERGHHCYIMVVNGYYSPNGWTPFGRNKAFRAGPCRKLRRISLHFTTMAGFGLNRFSFNWKHFEIH